MTSTKAKNDKEPVVAVGDAATQRSDILLPSDISSPFSPPDWVSEIKPKGLLLNLLLLEYAPIIRLLHAVQQWPAQLVFLYMPDERKCRTVIATKGTVGMRKTRQSFQQLAEHPKHDQLLQDLLQDMSRGAIAVCIGTKSAMPTDSLQSDLRLLLPKLPDAGIATLQVQGSHGYELSVAAVDLRLAPAPRHPVPDKEQAQGGETESTPEHSPDACIAQLEALISGVDVATHPFAEKLQTILNAAEGTVFDELEAKQRFASMLAVLLERLGRRVYCPRCNQPALLRAARSGNTKGGVFRFEHVAAGKTTHHTGRKQLAEIRLTTIAPQEAL